ncbi:MAG: trypsin-like peptidase domain-containing protein [Planctomycetota bacterium]
MVRSRTLCALILGALSWATAQDPDADLTQALADEAAQVALVARLSTSVAAVFPGEDPGQGGGSGVVIDPRGYVLTNFHVSGVARVLTVGLSDGRTYRARLLGIDPGGDIALLKLEGDRAFDAVPLGDSDALTVGERVYAMGNPFLLAEDYTPTVTEGVVSGLHRYRDASGSSDLVYGDSIQIDASINPGNSGGPLFDGEGRLLGINGLGGFRPDRGRVNVGVGFAASINQIRNFLWDLRACRQCQHGTMNATVRDQEQDDGTTRLVIDAIGRESGAFRAGLRLGDEVKRLNGVPLDNQNHLLTLVSRLPAGRRVVLEVERAREDGSGVYEVSASFRLEPLWSGPRRGEWVPEPALVAAETEALLEAFRASAPPRAWTVEGTLTRADGTSVRQVLVVDGPRVRVETGTLGEATVEVYDGDEAWVQRPGEPPAALAPARRDLLAGTRHARLAAEDPREQGRVSELELTGGDALGEQLVARLAVRDKAGRKRLLYFDAEALSFAGLAYPQGEAWVEERWARDGERLVVTRRDHETGALLERLEGRLTAGPVPAGSFTPEEAK